MSEVTVVNCTTEVANFSDGTFVMRQKPWLNTCKGISLGITQPDFFRGVFRVGRTIEECKKVLADPGDLPLGGDGRGVGR